MNNYVRVSCLWWAIQCAYIVVMHSYQTPEKKQSTQQQQNRIIRTEAHKNQNDETMVFCVCVCFHKFISFFSLIVISFGISLTLGFHIYKTGRIAVTAAAAAFFFHSLSLYLQHIPLDILFHPPNWWKCDEEMKFVDTWWRRQYVVFTHTHNHSHA